MQSKGLHTGKPRNGRPHRFEVHAVKGHQVERVFHVGDSGLSQLVSESGETLKKCSPGSHEVIYEDNRGVRRATSKKLDRLGVPYEPEPLVPR
jgi:hypothetical protein